MRLEDVQPEIACVLNCFKRAVDSNTAERPRTLEKSKRSKNLKIFEKYETFETFQTFEIFENFATIETLETFEQFETFEAFEKFETFGKFHTNLSRCQQRSAKHAQPTYSDVSAVEICYAVARFSGLAGASSRLQKNDCIRHPEFKRQTLLGQKARPLRNILERSGRRPRNSSRRRMKNRNRFPAEKRQ